MVSELVERNEEALFLAPSLAAGTGALLRSHNNLREFPRGGFARFLAYCSSDGVVLCGGSMFMDPAASTVGDRVRRYRRVLSRVATALFMRVTGRTYSIVGCNIGPIHTWAGGALLNALFRLCSSITVRDADSEIYLRSIGQHRVRRAPDMVFSWINRHALGSAAEAHFGIVGVSTMRWPGRTIDETVEEYHSLISGSLASGCTEGVRLFAFQETFADDRRVADALAARLSGRCSVEVVPYDGDGVAFVEAIAKCSGFIGVRLHSIILALGCGIPVGIVAYSGKTISALREVGVDVDAALGSRQLSQGQRGAVVARLDASPRSISTRGAEAHALLSGD